MAMYELISDRTHKKKKKFLDSVMRVSFAHIKSEEHLPWNQLNAMLHGDVIEAKRGKRASDGEEGSSTITIKDAEAFRYLQR